MPRIPSTQTHAFDDFFLGCIEYTPAFCASQPDWMPLPGGDGFVGRGGFITIVGAAESSDEKVRTVPSSKQKFSPPSSYVLRHVRQIFIYDPLMIGPVCWRYYMRIEFRCQWRTLIRSCCPHTVHRNEYSVDTLPRSDD